MHPIWTDDDLTGKASEELAVGPAPMTTNTTLNRNLSLPLITLYGLGNILGAGVYVLIGKVAGEAGYFAPLSFLLASFIAGLTAFSFAELASRYPVSAGEAVYVEEGFGFKRLSLTVGLLVVLTGIVSAATITKGFVGYLDVFIEFPDTAVIICLLTLLGFTAVWGILESVTVAALFTLLEVGGLVLILVVTAPALQQLPQLQLDPTNGSFAGSWNGIVGGAFLAFYAYIGFEDMVNVAEEVRNPRRNLPIAILIALGIASVMYILVTINSLLILTPQELGQSEAPLAAIFQTATGKSPWLISVISLFAVVNGALIQIIMASRVCYGLAIKNWLPAFLGSVNKITQTPINATMAITVSIIGGALWLPIETLAKTTTYLLLIIFILVNTALVKIKRRDENIDGIFQVNILVPIFASIMCFAFLLFQSGSLIMKMWTF